MSKYENFVGTTLGNFTVTSQIGSDTSGHKLYLCTCDNCGATIISTPYDLLNGRKSTTCRVCGGKNNNDEELDKDYDDYDENCDCDEDCDCNNIDDNEEVYRDPYEDTFTINPAIDGVEFFNGSIGYENNDDEVVYTVYPITNKLNVCVREIKTDMLTLPMYYHLAHCIPADLSCYGNTAQALDMLYNLSYNLEFFGEYGKCEVGSILSYSNIITMFPNAKGKTRPSYDNLMSCIKNLAFMCAEERIQFLAMPHVGCGGNHVKKSWEDVKADIIDTFIDTYVEAFATYQSEDDENFKPATIYISFCDYPDDYGNN